MTLSSPNVQMPHLFYKLRTNHHVLYHFSTLFMKTVFQKKQEEHHIINNQHCLQLLPMYHDLQTQVLYTQSEVSCICVEIYTSTV